MPQLIKDYRMVGLTGAYPAKESHVVRSPLFEVIDSRVTSDPDALIPCLAATTCAATNWLAKKFQVPSEES